MRLLKEKEYYLAECREGRRKVYTGSVDTARLPAFDDEDILLALSVISEKNLYTSKDEVKTIGLLRRLFTKQKPVSQESLDGFTIQLARLSNEIREAKAMAC